jgi:hypothetical protein
VLVGHGCRVSARVDFLQQQRAAEQFRLIGDQVTESPWRYFNDPGRAFASLRKVAYSKA